MTWLNLPLFTMNTERCVKQTNVLCRALVFGVFSLFLLDASQASAESFAYVDLQRAVFEVDDGKAAKNRLEKMKTERQKALDGKQKELKKLQESLEKQADFLSEEMKQKKAREFQTKLGELQAVYSKLQRELAEEEMKIQQQILGRMGEFNPQGIANMVSWGVCQVWMFKAHSAPLPCRRGLVPSKDTTAPH